MEFTERSELLRVLKEVRKPSKNPYIKDTSASLEAIDKMLEYADNLEDCLNYSPPQHLITQLPESFRAPSIDQMILSEHLAQEETPKSQRKATEEKETNVQVRKDEKYKETYEQSLRQVSTLTQSLMREDAFDTPESESGFITLTIYLFGTSDLLKVAVQRTITIEQCIQKTVSAYVRSPYQKVNPLRYPTHLEAYTLWLVEDDCQMPDKDFAVERSMKIGDLGAEALAFCEVEDFKAKDDIRAMHMESPLQAVSDITQAIALKICFEDNWTVVAVAPELKLRDVLTLLERKFPEAGYFSPEEFEFKIGVQVDTQLRHAEECGLDMDLHVGALGIKELKLHRKTYADSPSMISEKIRREMPSLSQDEEVKYDPQRLYMTKAQACAYQEYEVIKTNRRGKKQKRVLGIDQHRLYNMTESQAREAQKLAAGGHARASQIIRNKIEGLFKSVTHHPEILIANITAIRQEDKNLKEFVLEYREENMTKKKRYELENSSKVTEVVAKITKLMALSNSEG